jgi:hypothetical protein
MYKINTSTINVNNMYDRFLASHLNIQVDNFENLSDLSVVLVQISIHDLIAYRNSEEGTPVAQTGVVNMQRDNFLFSLLQTSPSLLQSYNIPLQ